MENFLRDGVDMQVLSSGTIAGEAHFFDDATTPAKVRSYLDSSKEADKLKGMKQLLAMLSKGRDIPEFFADVVKNVVVKSIEVKKMVYIYLVHYADFDANCREIALLSINSFQKDMNGPNQLIRGLALRVMTSIRVPDIIQIQLLAVRKCSGDSSPYVRKCAANALVKIFLLDKEQLESLKQILSSLLKDSSTMVLGSAVAAFNEICPTAYDVLHRNYRKLCHLLADMDEWTQISVLEVMTRYVRNQFTDPAPDVAAVVKLQAKQRSTAAVKGRTTTVVRRVVKKAFYSDEEDESEEETVEIKPEVDHQTVLENAINHDTTDNLDPDHRLILKSSLPLLKSRNSGVVLGVCSLHYYCGSQNTSTTAAVAKALVRILRNRREVQYVVLNSISSMARERPLMFRPYLTDFLVKSSDPHFNKMLKLEILSSICYKDNITPILREMETYVKDSNQKFVASAVKAIGRIADCDPKVSDSCIEGVMHLLLCSKKSEIVTSACVVVLRQLLQQNTTSAASHKVLHQLVKLLIIEDGIEEPVARSSIVWLVGEFHFVLEKVAPDILRILASGFTDESTETKAQILNLAIKLSLQLPEDENVQSLMTYVLEMSRYDVDTDLRDRSRFMTALMGLAPSNEEGDAPPIDEDALAEFAEHASEIMLAPKLPPITLLDSSADDGALSFTVGSMSALVGHYLQGYEPLSAWPEVQPSADVRDALKYAEQDAKDAAAASGKGGKGRKGGNDSSSEEEDLMAVFSKKKGKKDDSSSSSSSESESESGSDSGSENESEGSGEESSDESSEEDRKPKKKAPPAASSSSVQKAPAKAAAPASSGKGKSAQLIGDSESESSKSESESESSEEESEEDKPAARVPLAAQKVQPASKPTPAAAPVVAAAATKPAGVTRVGMRKVAPGKKKDPFGSSSEPLTALVDYGEAHETPAAKAAPAAAPSMNADQELDDFLLDIPTEKKSTAVSAHDDFLLGGSATMAAASSSSGPLNASTGDLVDKFAGMDFTGSSSTMGATPAGSGKLSHHAILNTFDSGSVTPSMPSPMGGPSMMGGGGGGGGIQLTRPDGGVGPVAVPVGSISLEDLAEPKVLLKPELGGGLTVSLVIRNNVTSVAYVGAISAYLLIKNVNKDRTLRRVRVSFPTDMRKTTVPEIPVMNPLQEIQFPMELVLSGMTGKQVKVDIRCDQGAYVGVMVVNDWDLLLPFTTTSADFEALRKRLGGFNEIVKSYPTSVFQFSTGDVADNEMELISRVKKIVNVYLVQGAGVGELMFAGTVRKALVEEKVFITILVSDDQVTLKFNSEDPLLSTGLNEAFKKLMPKLSTASSISL